MSEVAESSFGSATHRHIRNFLDCVKSRQQPVCNVEVGFYSTLPTLLATTALDGLFPPVPGETVVVSLAVAAHAGGGVPWWVVVPVAAVGAWSVLSMLRRRARAVGSEP